MRFVSRQYICYISLRIHVEKNKKDLPNRMSNQKFYDKHENFKRV